MQPSFNFDLLERGRILRRGDNLMENKMLLVARVRETLSSALAKDADLWGYSPLDLIADNIDGTLHELRAAIVSAGPFPQASARVQARIASYSRVVRSIQLAYDIASGFNNQTRRA